MVKDIDIQGELATRPFLHDRCEETEADADESFARLAPFRDGAIFAGSFSGESPWERHVNGDELVHVLSGEARLTILTDDGPQVLEMTAGKITVVPGGCGTGFIPRTVSPY